MADNNTSEEQKMKEEQSKKEETFKKKKKPEKRVIHAPKSFVEEQTASSTIVLAMGEKVITKTIMARPFAVTHLQFNGKSIYDKFLDIDFFKQVVNQYWVETFGGQVPSATVLTNYASAFKNYLAKAEEAFARMLQVTRVQNSFNLENEVVGKIGQLFNDPEDLNIAELQARLREMHYPRSVETRVNSKLKGTAGVYAVSTSGISNAVWSRKYVSPLAHVYLPEQVISMLKFLFSGVIQLSHDDDETLRYVCVWQPSNNPEPTGGNGQFPMLSDTTMDDFLVDYNTTISELEDLLSQYSSLKPILERMNWKCVRYASDWSRDLEGKTLNVFTDDNHNTLEYMLQNVILAQSDILTDDDLLGNSIIYERNDSADALADILRYPDRNIKISSLYNLENYMRGKTTSLCVNISNIYRAGGSTSYNNEVWSYTADNYIINSGTHAQSLITLANGIDATTDVDALTAGPLHTLNIEGAIAGEIDIHIAESRLEGSARTYLIPEEDIGQIIFCVNSALFLDYSALKQVKINTAKTAE